MISAMSGKPRFVSIDEVEMYRNAAEAAKQDTRQAQKTYQEMTAQEESKVRQRYPAILQFDYKFDRANKEPFNISEIYRDDKFTYIKGVPQETPTVYEVKDGKPSLIQYQFSAGLYTIPKIVDQGYLVVGKKKLAFHRLSAAR